MWKNIDNMDHLYQVNENGDVRRLYDDGGCKLLQHSKTVRGYHYVTLRKNGKNHLEYVHRLVAKAFIQNPQNKDTVNHIDGNKNNNHISNLEWSTYSENNQHAYDTKLKLCGEDFYNAKLKVEDVVEIKKNGKYTTYQNIADKYGVTKATIRDILINRTWQNVVV